MAFLPEMNSAPVNVILHKGLRRQLYPLQGPFFEFLKAYPVDDVACKFFSPGSFWINVFFCKFVSIQDYLYNGISSAHIRKPSPSLGFFLSGTSHNGETVIFFPASCPGPGRAFGDADTAAYTFLCIPDNLIISVYRKLVAAFDTVVGAASKGNLKMQVTRENSFPDPFCKGRRVVVSVKYMMVSEMGSSRKRASLFQRFPINTLLYIL